MSKHKSIIKIVSIMLSLIILLTALPLGVSAVDTATVTSNATVEDVTSENISFAGARVRAEEGDGLNTIVIDNGDGTHTMTLYDHPVKYVDEKGEVQDISLEIAQTTDGSYKTKANDIQTVFPQKISDGISLSGKGVSVKLTPSAQPPSEREVAAEPSEGVTPSTAYSGNSLNPSTADAVPLPLDKGGNTGTEATLGQISADTTVTRLDNETVSYYYDNKTTLEYSLTYTGFKEDIVVSEYTGQTEYHFLLETGGLTLTKIDESYYLTDSEGTVKATLGDIIIFTADEQNNTLGSMTHTMVKENQQYIITIHVDAEYLKDEKTKYPIRIDPTIELTATGTNAIEDVTINSTGVSGGDETELFVGKRDNYGISRVLMKFPGLNLSDIPTSLHIISADVHMYDLVQETAAMKVMCYFFTGEEWTESTANWSNVNANSYTHFLSQDTISWWRGKDYSPAHTYKFSILDYIKYCKDEKASFDQGIIFKAPDNIENGTDAVYKKFASYNSSTHRPYITVVYSENEINYAAPFGWFDHVTNVNIKGWAWCVDTPKIPVDIDIYLVNETTGQEFGPLMTKADIYRADLESKGYGTGRYGFLYPIDWSKYPGGQYAVSTHAVNIDGVSTILQSDPKYYYNLGIYLSDHNVTLISGNTHVLTVGYYDMSSSGSAVTWSSSNNSVASVSNGIVTANSAGVAEITATFGEYSATCAVTVDNINYGPSDIGVNVNKAYWIREVGTNNYLAVENGDWKAGSNVKVIIPKGDDTTVDKVDTQVPYLYWKFEETGFEYTLTPFNSLEMMLSVEDGVNSNNTNVELYDLKDKDLGKWKIVPTGENRFVILSKVSNYTKGLKIMSGNNISIYNAAVATEWEFVEVDCLGEDGQPLDYAYGHPLIRQEVAYASVYDQIPPSLIYNNSSNNLSEEDVQQTSNAPVQGETTEATADISNAMGMVGTNTIEPPAELLDTYCPVYKCVMCDELFFPPELQDIYILTEEEYVTILALQRAYTENLIEGDIIKADATMRIMNQLRDEFGYYYNTSFYDFRDGSGNYVGCYKYLYDSYDGFYIDITTTDTTGQAVDVFLIDAMANMPGPIGYFYTALSFGLREAEYHYARSFSDGITTTVYNDAVWAGVVDFSVQAIVTDAACKEFSFVVDCFRMAWGMNGLISTETGMFQYNYAVSIEYCVPKNDPNDIEMTKAVHVEYEFNDKSNINITLEGFRLGNGYSGFDVLGQYKCNISNISNNWIDIAGN